MALRSSSRDPPQARRWAPERSHYIGRSSTDRGKKADRASSIMRTGGRPEDGATALRPEGNAQGRREPGLTLEPALAAQAPRLCFP
jgi:hypothetical protein